MNIKALITTLAIVGSSSVAMARPASHSTVSTVTASAQASVNFGFGPTIRDHRTTPAPVYQQPQFGRDYRESQYDRMNRFVTLDSDLQFATGEYRKDIMPGVAQRYSTLKIDADRSTYLMKVVVEFADGTSQQQIDLKKQMRAGESLTLDLAGNSHTINRILVYRADGNETWAMAPTYRGDFTVSAR